MSGQKRKRESKTSEIRITSYTEDSSAYIGAIFNGVQIPETTEFDVYKHKKHEKYVLHGETDTLEYSGASEHENNNDYIVGLYDPLNKSVDLFKAPYLNTKIVAKSTKKYTGPSIKSEGVKFKNQRDALGEAFGTKKAKSAIASAERNKIDADKLADIELDIIDDISKSTETLPSRTAMAQDVVHDQPIPTPNIEATNVEDIYLIFSIIPKKEWQYLRVQPLLEESDDNKRLDLLPFGKSKYISKILPKLIKQNNSEKIQLAIYASLLFGVYSNRRVKDKDTLMTRLENKPSEILIDGILQRFTINKASQFGKSKDRSFVIDPHHEDKLLCYLLAIILHLDNFLVELQPLAHELGMKSSRLQNLFRALGCIVKGASIGQAEAFGIAKAMASTYKVASLKVPFKLPEMTRSGKRR